MLSSVREHELLYFSRGYSRFHRNMLNQEMSDVSLLHRAWWSRSEVVRKI